MGIADKSRVSNHTPGPWCQSYRERPDGMYATEVYDQRGEVVATVAWYPVQLPDGWVGTAREANACLIAAAPELLVACSTLVERFGHTDWTSVHDTTALEYARKVIAKAEGKEE